MVLVVDVSPAVTVERGITKPGHAVTQADSGRRALPFLAWPAPMARRQPDSPADVAEGVICLTRAG
jgi:hypothetical protein